MSVTFEQFYRAIAQQESGNNYRAVGVPTKWGRAYGKYQVLQPNIAPWTKKYYGRALTPQQFLANPAAQEAVARGELQRLYNAHGARGAASAWYSGNPSLHNSTRAQPGGPSIKSYVDSVIRIAGGMSTSSTGAGNPVASPSTYTAAVPKMSRSETAENFGLSLSLVNSNKELKSLFDKAVKGSWTASRFQAALKNTKWWRGQSADLRKYITLRYTDPATWKQDRNNARAAVRAMAVQIGIKGISSKDLDTAVYNKLALGWSDARIKDWLGGKVKAVNGQFVGAAGEIQDEILSLAYQNGVKYSSSWYSTQIKAISAGKRTVQEIENRIRKDAAAKYSAFSAQIKAGMNALDLAAPYVAAVSGLLEVPQTDVDLWNKHVQKAMTAKQTGGVAYSLWQFENDLRNDSAWRRTNNARESMMSTARQVARDFGIAY